MLPKPVILESKEDILYFRGRVLEYVGVDFPLAYFEQGFIRAFKDKAGDILGGYALITKGPFRTLCSIPSEVSLPFNEEELGEITALWLEPKKMNRWRACLFWYVFSRDIFKLKSKNYFIYAYNVKQSKLGKLYKLVRPIELYRGKVKQMEGNAHEAEEIIEFARSKEISLLPIRKFPHFFCKMFLNRAFLSRSNRVEFKEVQKDV